MKIVQLFEKIETAISNRNQVEYLHRMSSCDSFELHEAEKGVERALAEFGDAVRADPEAAMQEAVASENVAIVNEVSYFIEHDDS